jgi:hypothetical protein
VSGPAKPTSGSYRLPDGRWHHTLRQSWLNDALGVCLERARRDRLALLQRTESDAAALGTAVHAGIEHLLTRPGSSLSDAIEKAHDEWHGIAARPNFRWVSFDEGDHALVHGYIDTALAAFERETLPLLGPEAIEASFAFVIHEDGERVIELVGTIDYIGSWSGVPVVADWKTGKRKYSESEKQSQAIQASVYTAAAEAMGFGRRPFRYGVMVRGKDEVQVIDVTRWPAHDEWLRDQCLSLAHLLEADLPTWPLNDQHFLCSSTWCPAWDTCKGRRLG